MDDIYTLSDTQLGKRIGEKLKAIRLKRNITQQSLAEAASISLSSVKGREWGNRVIRHPATHIAHSRDAGVHQPAF